MHQAHIERFATRRKMMISGGWSFKDDSGMKIHLIFVNKPSNCYPDSGPCTIDAKLFPLIGEASSRGTLKQGGILPGAPSLGCVATGERWHDA